MPDKPAHEIVAELVAAGENASPEWYVGDFHEQGSLFLQERIYPESGPPITVWREEVCFDNADDAWFCSVAANSRPALKALLAEHEALREALEGLIVDIDDIYNKPNPRACLVVDHPTLHDRVLENVRAARKKLETL